MQSQLEHGGLLLWVIVRDAEREARAQEILKRHGALDVHVHELPLAEMAERNPLGGVELDPWLPDARV